MASDRRSSFPPGNTISSTLPGMLAIFWLEHDRAISSADKAWLPHLGGFRATILRNILVGRLLMVRRRYSLALVGSAVALGSLLAGCGGSTPSKATPAPTPAPTATPAPAATPSVSSCPLGPSSNPDALVNPCPGPNAQLGHLVGGAIDYTNAHHPALFNL